MTEGSCNILLLCTPWLHHLQGLAAVSCRAAVGGEEEEEEEEEEEAWKLELRR